LYLISHKIAVFSIFQFHLFFYFATGIALAYIYRHHRNLIEKSTDFFKGKLYLTSAFLFTILVLLKQFTINMTNDILLPWVHILWAFPLTYLLAICLNHQTAISKFLSKKALVFLGTISYSIYLSHSAIIRIVEKFSINTDLETNMIQLFLIFFITVIFSLILYTLLEKPYFIRPKEALSIAKNKDIKYISYKKTRVTLCLFFILYIGALFIAFESNFNFFSQQYAHSASAFISPKVSLNQTEISLEKHPHVEMLIQAQEDNFGILSLHTEYHLNPKKEDKKQMMIFTIKDATTNHLYASSGYELSSRNNNLDFPFGFPVIRDSKGKKYIVTFTLTDISSGKYITIDTSKMHIRSVYNMNKKEMLSHPIKILSLIDQRLLEVIKNYSAQLTFLLFLPFIALCILLLHKDKRDLK
jgi:hypothetical protein